MLGRQQSVGIRVAMLGMYAAYTLSVNAWSDNNQTDCSKFFSPETTPYEGRLPRQGVLCVRGEKVGPELPVDKAHDEPVIPEDDVNLLPPPAAGGQLCQPAVEGETCLPEQHVQGPPN